MMRVASLVLITLGWMLSQVAVACAQAPAAPPFATFLADLWPDAQAKGVSRKTFDAALAGVTADPRVVSLTQRQPEYGKPFGDYVAMLASASRVKTGQAKAREWRDTLSAVEKTYGVDRNILLAIWGAETSYGATKTPWDVIRSLATLAQMPFRPPYFRDELITALTILQDGRVSRSEMRGSWAGAMGQPQFMPSSYKTYAVDFTRDGHPDIWSSVPDIAASIANYLRAHGWTPGLPWGFEVQLPEGYDYRQSSRASFAEWDARGLRTMDGRRFPNGDGILFFPAGSAGPAFLVTENHNVLKRYNNSDAYALAVGHLADGIAGRGPIRTAWPRDDRQLSLPERIALQRKLAELGFKVNDFDGRFDFDLRDNVRELQTRFGQIPDGHPSVELMRRLGLSPP